MANNNNHLNIPKYIPRNSLAMRQMAYYHSNYPLKKVLSKQFIVEADYVDNMRVFADMNERLSRKVDKYLRSFKNLSHYNVHISRVDRNTRDIPINIEIATVTLIRK